MVVLDTTLTDLNSYLKQSVTVDELEEILLQLGFEIDEQVDDELKIDITPDRLDALSTIGLARVLNAFMTGKTPVYEAKPSEYEVIVDDSVKKIRPHTVCAVVKNIHLDDEKIKEIIWIQEKLHATFGKNRQKAAIGIYPMEKITWPVTFIAKKPDDISFHPLEAQGEMTGTQIVTEHETGKMYAHLLEGKDMYPLFIDGSNEILSMPPIINSHKTGRIDTNTTDVFIECSGFEVHALSPILNMICCVLQDMGGELYAVTVNHSDDKLITPELHYEKKRFLKSQIKEVLGVEPANIVELLEKMQYQVRTEGDSIIVRIPPFRKDIWHTVDIIDDVSRAIGLNNFEIVKPQVPTEGGLSSLTRFLGRLTDTLVGYGFQEIKTLGVTDKADQYEKMNIEPESYIPLGSTAERNINMVRTWLLPESLKFLSNNQSAPQPHNVFEIGDCVIPADTDVLSQNIPKLSISQSNMTFTDMKKIITSTFALFGHEIETIACKHDSFIVGRAARVLLDGEDVGVIGEVSPVVLVNWGIEYPVVSCDIDLRNFE